MTRLATFALAATVAAGSLAALAIPETLNRTIEGRAFAIDADTLVVQGVRVRLAEIDAPELAQTCTMPDGKTWMCGRVAAEAVQRMLAEGTVRCTLTAFDRYGRSVGSCEASGEDIAAHLVAVGLAVIWPRYSHGTYEDRQAAAKAEKIGVWSGSFDWPWQWRHQK